MKRSRRVTSKKKPSPSKKYIPSRLSSYQAKVYLLSYLSHPPLNRLYSAVVREVCSYLAIAPILICPEERYLHFFDASKGNWSSIEYPQNGLFSEYTRYLHLGDEKMFACGGTRRDCIGAGQTQSPSNCAFLLSLQGQFEQLPDMEVGRVTPGLIECYSQVFAFGGCNKTGYFKAEVFSSGESFSLLEKEWTDLPAMRHGRREFCPCVWRWEIYLCGGGSPVVEAYHPVEARMRELPVQVQAVDIMSISFARGEELVGLSNSFIAVLRYEGEELLAAIEAKKTFELFQRQLPVVWGGNVYIVLSNGCIALEVKTLGEVNRYPIAQKGLGS